QVAGLAPALGELVQGAVETLPVAARGLAMRCRPGLHFLDQAEARGAVLGGLRLDLVQPLLHHLVGLVAGFVEALPQRVVRRAALVHLLPLLAQVPQLLLGLAAAKARLRRRRLLAL